MSGLEALEAGLDGPERPAVLAGELFNRLPLGVELADVAVLDFAIEVAVVPALFPVLTPP